MSKLLSRRSFLRSAGVGAAAAVMAACQPEVVEKIVKETVEVEKVVTQVVKETVMVEGESKEVTKVVEKVVTTTPAPTKPMELNTWQWVPGSGGGGSSSGIPDDDALIQATVEKEFNVKFNIWWVERATWVEQLSTRFAGGEYCDYGNLWQDAWIEQGLLGHITLTDFAASCPKFFSDLVSYDNGSLECFYGGIWRGSRITYGVYVPKQIFPFSPGYRKDSLDKAGLPVPETLDELETTIKTFLDQGLHKVGVKEVFSGRNLTEPSGAYGAYRGAWQDGPDGELINGDVHPGYAKGLAVANEWWNQGLIDPDSLTLTWADQQAAWCQGDMGFCERTWYRFVPRGAYYDCVITTGGEVVAGPHLKGPNGDYGTAGWGKGRNGTMISSQTERDAVKKAKVLEMVDALAADDEWAFFSLYGEANVHSYQDEFGTWYRKADEDMPVPVNEIGYSPMPFVGLSPRLELSWMSKNDMDTIAMAGGRSFETYDDLGKFADFTPCVEFTELGQVANKFYNDCISGEKDAVNDWDAYVNDYMAQGGECQQKQAREAQIAGATVKRSIDTEVANALASMS